MDKESAEGGTRSHPLVKSETDDGAKREVGRPCVLGEGLPPVPHKLAVRIVWGEYLDI